MRLSVTTRPKPDRQGTLPLYILVTHGGIKRYVALGVRVPARDWNPRKREVRASNEHADQINGMLADWLAAAKSAALDVQAGGRHFTVEDVKAAVEAAVHPEADAAGERSPDLLAYAQAALDRYTARGQIATALAYGSGVNALSEYAGGGPLPFDAVTVRYARGFEAHLTGVAEGRGMKPNTVHKYVSAIKTIIKQAVEEGVPGAMQAQAAFAAVKLKKERAEKARLTFDQVRAIEALDLRGRKADARDWFVCAFYLGGMRFSDVALLKWSAVDRGVPEGHPWRVRWRQKKTGDAQSLPAIGGAQAVLERWHARTGPEGEAPSPYVFGLLTDEEGDPAALRAAVSKWNALANKYLYQMEAKVGAPKAGFHAARHSLADHLRKSGLSIYDISKALGHANIRVTEAYLASFDAEDLDAKLSRALGPRG